MQETPLSLRGAAATRKEVMVTGRGRLERQAAAPEGPRRLCLWGLCKTAVTPASDVLVMPENNV